MPRTWSQTIQELVRGAVVGAAALLSTAAPVAAPAEPIPNYGASSFYNTSPGGNRLPELGLLSPSPLDGRPAPSVAQGNANRLATLEDTPAAGRPLTDQAFEGLGEDRENNSVVMVGDQPYDSDGQNDLWTWQALPNSLIYHSYLAGAKEPRLGSFFAYDKQHGGMWDITLGGRVGLLRYGSQDCLRPQGWQFDLEGAAFPRLDFENNEDLMAADFRAGGALTYGRGSYQAKFSMYHLSSHAGDEYMLRLPMFQRINYSRNVFVWGHSYYWNSMRVYGEAGVAFDYDVSKPWEFQAGLEYSPLRPSAPFAALNLHSREEVNFGGNIVLQAGWQWRAASRLFRIGLEYYDGKSDQFEFYSVTEQKVGAGFWYDF